MVGRAWKTAPRSPPPLCGRCSRPCRRRPRRVRPLGAHHAAGISAAASPAAASPATGAPTRADARFSLPPPPLYSPSPRHGGTPGRPLHSRGGEAAVGRARSASAVLPSPVPTYGHTDTPTTVLRLATGAAAQWPGVAGGGRGAAAATVSTLCSADAAVSSSVGGACGYPPAQLPTLPAGAPRCIQSAPPHSHRAAAAPVCLWEHQVGTGSSRRRRRRRRSRRWPSQPRVSAHAPSLPAAAVLCRRAHPPSVGTRCSAPSRPAPRHRPLPPAMALLYDRATLVASRSRPAATAAGAATIPAAGRRRGRGPPRTARQHRQSGSLASSAMCLLPYRAREQSLQYDA